jgi:Zn-dependent M28 family amino/carboxypeptidase
MIATFGPEEGETIVIGAHYDAYGKFLSADDNASGVAGLLVLAKNVAR